MQQRFYGFFTPSYSGTDNLVKLLCAGVMQIAPYREGGGNFTRGRVTFFDNVLFSHVTPRCPGLLTALEENTSLLYFSGSRRVFSHWGITESQNSRGWKGPLWVI